MGYRRNTGSEQYFLAGHSLNWFAVGAAIFPREPTPDSKDQSCREKIIGHKGVPNYFPDMVAYLDKQVGIMMLTLDDLGIGDNTLLIFLADNGTDRDLVNTWGDGKRLRGGKGTMTDRGTHVPLLVRWPGHIKAGSKCDDLVDFSDLLPTLCELAEAPLPPAEIHGRSFAPQLLGKAGNPRQWVHIQHEGDRQVRNSDYMLNNQNQLRRVVQLWEDPAPPNENLDPEKEAADRKSLQSTSLQSTLDALGK